ncbi:unnamed protein product, partial [Hapterophycus canaliculatus]
QQQQTRKKEERPALDVEPGSYTTQMRMDDLEYVDRSRGAASPRFGPFLYPLRSATYMGRADLVELMLRDGYHVDQLDDDGCTPLQIAAGLGLADVTKALLAAGADVTLRDSL